MKSTEKNNYCIMAGAMGAGKSTIIKTGITQNYKGVEEPARLITVEQRSIGGSVVYEQDPKLFIKMQENIIKWRC